MSYSLAEPTGRSPLIEAVLWIQGTLLGTTATVCAVLAVAVMGAMMLTGRINLKNAVNVVLGCFILFGAPSIAAGIQSLLTFSDNPAPTSSFETMNVAPARPQPPLPSSNYDPYAGASVPNTR